jgi:uncharacterized membrane protein YphA (DoxX/SURF4 family)
VKNAPVLKTAVRALFGVAWLLDGAWKFQPGMADIFVSMTNQSISMHPAILQPWASFWAGQVAANPNLFVLLIGALELVLGLALIFGFMRKITYTGGILLSLLVWDIAEGLGGVFMAGVTDVGAGIVYVYVFLLLIIIEATYGTSRYSLDYYIEKRFGWWKKLAELKY